MMYSGTLNLAKNQGFSTSSHQENVTSSLKSYFRYCGVCPKLTAARKRQLHHNPALSQWHFIVVFCQFRQKPGFFMQNVSKRSPTAFLVVVALCSITLKVLGCFLFIFATTVANTSSARARTKKSTQKCQKSRFCDVCTKNHTFSLKTGAKAHTELQQKKTSLTKQFHVEKGVFSKFSPTMSHLSDTSGHRGYIFTTLFLHIQTR